MNFLPTIIGTSFDCTVKDPERSPVFVFSKLTEECCELNDVFYGIAASEPLNGEIADVIISAIDLLYVMDYRDQQVHGCMTKKDLIDTITFRLGLPQGIMEEGACLEEEWFRVVGPTPEKHLAMVFHLLGRITRLLNQPDRSRDILEVLISDLIKFTARMACAKGMIQCESVKATRVKVEHTIEHKVEKWRGKFGL